MYVCLITLIKLLLRLHGRVLINLMIFHFSLYKCKLASHRTSVVGTTGIRLWTRAVSDVSSMFTHQWTWGRFESCGYRFVIKFKSRQWIGQLEKFYITKMNIKSRMMAIMILKRIHLGLLHEKRQQMMHNAEYKDLLCIV